MGTFHDHSKMGANHGMSVVIDTAGPLMYAGQCHQETDDEVILTHADVLDTSQPGAKTKEAYLIFIAKFGVFARQPSISVPRSEITSFRLLKDLPRE